MASVLELILRTKKEGTAAKETSKDLLGLEKLAKKVTVSFLAMGAAKVIKSSTMLAARVETLGVVTKTLGANVNMTEREVRTLERAIVSQGITLQASRQSIAMMIQANVDLAHATDLARLAQNTAVIANLNSSEAFEQLVYVLQTGNVRMARTLGLNVQFGQAQDKLAKELGKTTAALTEQEIMQARTNAVMEAGERIANVYEDAMGTAGKTILSMERPLEELSRIFGEAFLPALEPTVTGLYNLLTGLTKVRTAMEEHTDEMIYGKHTYEEYYDEAERLTGHMEASAWVVDALTKSERELARAIEGVAGATDGWNKSLTEVVPIIDEFPELEVTATTEPAKVELETFDEWLTRWSRENRRKVQLQAGIRISEELATAITEEGRYGGEFRAGGGPVSAGRPYVVGEREAELFVPNQSGHIYNQQQLAGGDININTGIAQRAFNNMAEDWMRGLGG